MFGTKSVVGYIRKVERLAKAGVGKPGGVASRESEHIRLELEALLEPMPASSERAAGHRALSYVEALKHIDDDEHQDAILCLTPVAMARHIESGHAQGQGKPDQVLSNSYFLLGREYLPYGQWDLCTEFFFYSVITGANRTVMQEAGVLALICSSYGDEEMYAGIRDQFDEVTHEGILRCQTVLDATRGNAPISADANWYRPVWDLSERAGALLIERVARALNRREEYRAALFLSQNALSRIPAAERLDWLRAALLQTSAQARFGLGAFDDATVDAERSWNESERLRYGNCDHEMRESAWERFRDARTAALRAAVALDDAERVARYIQKDRLRGSVSTWLEATEDDTDVPAPIDSGIHVSSDNAKTPTQGSEQSAPAGLFRALEDAWNSTRLLPPSSSTADIESMTIPWWLGIARYGSMLFWTVIRHGIGVECGYRDVSGTDLGDLLLDLEEDITGRVRPDGQVSIFDPKYHFAEWGTAEERIASLCLGELIPPSIASNLRATSADEPMELVVAAGSGLEGVPWPILQVGRPDAGGFRLVERARIRHWLSQDVEDARSGHEPATAPLPILIAIDDPDDGLAGDSDYLKNHALTYFSGRLPPTDAPKASLKTALYGYAATDPVGVLFYRGHASSGNDPVKVSIDMPPSIAIPEDLDDLTISAGEFFGRFDDGSRYLPLPSRVVLSCCSSASASLFGGEAVGLAAACIVGGGAREVVATGRDVTDCSFTSAFDDMLAEAMTSPESHDSALRTLQLRMYDEWRTFSVRGGIHANEDIRFPHPLIWAMYQAI